MKKPFTRIIETSFWGTFVLLVIGLFAFSAAAQTLPKVELVVNGVKSGTAYSTIVKQLGKPMSEEVGGENPCTDAVEKKLTYDGLEINVDKSPADRDYTLLDMTVTSSKWVTDKGIKIGATPKQVIAKYGKTPYEDAFERPQEEKIYTGEKWLMYEIKNGVGSVTFYFKNNRLVRIELKPTIC